MEQDITTRGRSIFLSVDPLAEEYPSVSPYAYTFQNPIKLVDPTGMSPEAPGPKPRPLISTLWNNYNRKGQEVIKEVGGKVLKYQNQNTCAIKLSYTLNKSGEKVPLPKDLPKNIRASTSDNGESYIYGSTDMNNYLHNTYGTPDITITGITDKNLKEKIGELKGKQGIYSLRAGNPGDNGFGAAGHVDLVGYDADGRYILGMDKGTKDNHLNGYSGSGTEANPSTIYFWELPGDTKPKEKPSSPAPKSEDKGFFNRVREWWNSVVN